ncbi:MAG: DUF1640 domain-containing protein [Nitrospinae bacterium]|nr:DUF1640 domain-containing protein [Nitrospinota bacterium]
MNKAFIIILSLVFRTMYPSANVFAVEVAPRISDREIVEKLARLEEGQRAIQQQINDLRESTQQQINDLRESTQQQIGDLKESTQQQISDLKESTNDLKESTQQQINDLKESTNKRFDVIQWMLGLFITVALSLMGIMGRILWNQQKKLTQIETSLEAQKEELSFLKSLIEKLQALIEKLLPPRGVL